MGCTYLHDEERQGLGEDVDLLDHERREGVVDEGEGLEPAEPGGDGGALVEDAGEHDHGGDERGDWGWGGGSGVIRGWVARVGGGEQKERKEEEVDARMVMPMKGLEEKEETNCPSEVAAQLPDTKVRAKAMNCLKLGSMPA